jgi:hypothetical protein
MESTASDPETLIANLKGMIPDKEDMDHDK